MTMIPGRVTVSFRRPLTPEGRRPITHREEAALKRMFARLPVTFDTLVRPTEALARRIIEKSGGRLGGTMPAEGTWTAMAGYLLPGSVAQESELDYALRVLWHLLFARSIDIEEARKNAWTAGLYAQEASLKFRWETHAMRGLRNLQSVRTAALAKAEKARAQSKARAWLARVERRPRGLSKEAAYRAIEREENLKVGSVKKAVLRLKVGTKR